MMTHESIPVVVLAGGKPVNFGRGYIPKGSIRINGIPLVIHIINKYINSGFSDFYICAGEGFESIQEDLALIQQVRSLVPDVPIKIQLIYTGGIDSTGSRVRQALAYLGKKTGTIAISYIDTISDVPLEEVLKLHEAKQAEVTMTAVNLPTRFKVIGHDVFSPRVRGFSKKPIIENNIVSGGFYFVECEAFLAVDNPSTNYHFENDFLHVSAEKGKAYYYKHEGYWQFIDGPRDINDVEAFIGKQEKTTRSSE